MMLHPGFNAAWKLGFNTSLTAFIKFLFGILALFLPSLKVRGWGRSFIVSGYRDFPASGYRHRDSGAFNNLAIEGDSWSSSSYGAGNINGGYLYTHNVNDNPLNGANRPNGLPVRCVQELTGS